MASISEPEKILRVVPRNGPKTVKNYAALLFSYWYQYNELFSQMTMSLW